MKKLLLCWGLGFCTLFAFTFFLENSQGRSLLEIVGILMMVVIINLMVFALLYVEEN